MSERVVALLKGVNVGGHHRVEMSRLRQMLVGMGFSEVQTHLQSGNAVFTCKSAARLADRIEKAIAAEFGFSCRIVVRTARALADALESDPLASSATDGSRHFVGFMSSAPDAGGSAKLSGRSYGADRLHIAGDQLYLWCPNGLSKSPFFKIDFDRTLGVAVTLRNWNTATRLLEMAEG